MLPFTGDHGTTSTPFCCSLVSGGVEIMRANVDEVTRTCLCILRIFYIFFQLYLSHKLHNSQADHPRRTDWYADLICNLETTTRMANGPHL